MSRFSPEFARSHARAISGGWIVWLKCPEIAREAKPGQFVMVRCGEECVLPRPFSIHQVKDDNVAIFYAVLEDGKGTGWLSKRRADDKIEIFGPSGNGFSIHQNAKNLLLVAGGIGIAPLYFLAEDAARRGRSVTLLYGTADRNRYPRLPSGIKLAETTDDGSVGKKGKATDLLSEFIDWADQIFACGPTGMYKAIDSFSKQFPKLKTVQLSLEVVMGCGRGVCYGCTIKTRNGLKTVCEDGPVFELDDILWHELKY